jgi:tetratricopeptide (TPR) repeat protein
MGYRRIGASSDPAWDGLSVLSAEPVGVWRTYQTHEDYRATEPVTEDRASGGLVDRPRSRLLSACLIVRNEEQRLRSCLESIEDLVDEIVVVDTGSEDRTKEIARKFNARVFDFPWRNDFAAARNEAHRHARGDWILSIDADETAQAGARQTLRHLLSDDTKGGYYVLFRRRANLTPNWQMKLYRNHPGLRHKSIIHEAVLPEQVRSHTGRRLGHCPLLIEHSGYDGDLEDKHRRNLPLLRRALEHEPDHPDKAFIWRHLADIQEARGDLQRAADSRSRAAKVLQRKGELHPVDSAIHLGILTRRAHQKEDIGPLLADVSRLFPNNLQLSWIRGRWLMDRGEYSQAIPCFEELIEKGKAGNHSHWVGYDQRLFDTLSRGSVAECLSRMGSTQKYR